MNKKEFLNALKKLLGLLFIYVAFIDPSLARGHNESHIHVVTVKSTRGAHGKIVKKKTTTKKPSPWFTGPLLAPAGHTIPAGHVNFEPYIFYTDDYGFYNSQWKHTHAPRAENISPTMIFSYGLTKWMDIQVSAPYSFNKESGQRDSDFNDVGLTLGFQLLNDKSGTWIPDLRFTVEETFPNGRFDRLNPAKFGTDAFGAGVYQTTIAANFQKLASFKNDKYLRTRVALIYTAPASTHVRGISAFGGAPDTDGRINLYSKFNTDLGLEYTLTQHWVPALDILYTYSSSSRFHGFPGTTSLGLPAEVGSSKGDLVSLAPAIEYNFNEHIGIIAGSWFSVYGRNRPDFASAVAAINIYY